MSRYYSDGLYDENHLEHHGILGMKWGVRRFQNPDGTLSAKGKKRYLKEVQRDMEAHYKSNISSNAAKYIGLNKNGTTRADQRFGEAYRKGKVSGDDYYKAQKAAKEAYKYAESKYGTDTMKALSQSGVLGRPIKDFNPSTTKAGKELIDKINSGEKNGLTDKQKKALTIGAAAVGTAVAIYGGYKISQHIKEKAGESIVKKGNSQAADLMKKAGEYRNLAGSAGNLPGQMHRHILYTSKAVNTENKAAEVLKKSVDEANTVSKSTIESAKYLYSNKMKPASEVNKSK